MKGREVLKLTEKQKRFCEEYLIDLNATRAYMAAYKSVKKETVARANASRMLTNANVKTYIDGQLKKIEDSKIADAAEVMKYLTRILRGEELEEVIVVEGEGDGMSSARVMDKALNQKDRLKAAELLGKRYALFTEKVEVDNSAEEEKAKKLDNIANILNQIKPVKDGDV